VVQAFFFDSIFFGVLAGRLGGVKTVLSSRRDMGFWYRPFLLTVLRGLNLLTTRIVANSEAVRGVVLCRERVSRGKIDIMANGIDLASLDFAPPARRLARASLGLSSGQIAIGLIANMSRAVKRVDLLVRAAGRVARSHGAKLRFFVLGEGHLKEGLIELTRSLGLAETVRFLTWPITRERLLPALDIGALTSDSEGFSNAVLEYLAAGLPVVVSDVGGNRELVVDGSNGFLFPPGDADALAEKIQSLSTDDTLRLSLAASARDSVRGYDWGARIPHMLRYYRSFDGVRT
jgi:glycosyltransferase involved in cell wall biosynthesis